MKAFFTGVGAAIAATLGILFFFLKKSPSASNEYDKKQNELEKKSDQIKDEVKELDKKLEEVKKPSEGGTLESELDYWNKEKK